MEGRHIRGPLSTALVAALIASGGGSRRAMPPVVRRYVGLGHGGNMYAYVKPSEQKHTSGQRRVQRQQAKLGL